MVPDIKPLRALGSQFARFAMVGGAATLSHVVIAMLCYELLDLRPLRANFFAFCGALFVSYLGNHRWTFAMRGEHLARFPRFVVTAVTGLALNQSIVYAMVEVMGWHYRFALAAVILIVPALSFLLNRGWVFSPKKVSDTFSS